jgi:hypothetical protein
MSSEYDSPLCGEAHDLLDDRQLQGPFSRRSLLSLALSHDFRESFA